MKEEICKAFCDDVTVREVPIGLAVSTSFRRSDGDAVAFYVVRDPAKPGLAHLEDDGETIPYLEAAGVDFETQTRARAFDAILAEYEAEFDENESIIHSKEMAEKELPRTALRFAALLLRLHDFLLLTQEHVESTFKEDATKRIKEAVGDRAKIDEGQPVSSNLSDVKPDLVVRAPDRPPVAVFLAQSSQKVNDAVFLQMAALYEVREVISVVALLEVENSINRDLRQRAANRLAAVPIYRGEEQMSVQRVVREALGASVTSH